MASMTKLETIEQLIASLKKEDIVRLAIWLDEFRAEEWDGQIEADAKAGKLDRLITQARAEIAAGKVRDL